MELNVRYLVAPMMILLFVFSTSCKTGAKLPDPQPLPAGQSWAGLWFSPQFEHMYLRQTGDDVNGIYTYKFGGTLQGKTNGNLMTFEWIDPGDKTEARRSIKGKGWLQMTREGDQIRLKGEWGYEDNLNGGGIWEAEFVRTMTAEDPRSLDDWKREQGMIR